MCQRYETNHDDADRQVMCACTHKGIKLDALKDTLELTILENSMLRCMSVFC